MATMFNLFNQDCTRILNIDFMFKRVNILLAFDKEPVISNRIVVTYACFMYQRRKLVGGQSVGFNRSNQNYSSQTVMNGRLRRKIY